MRLRILTDLFRQKFVRKTLKYTKYSCGFPPFSDEKSLARLSCRFVRYCLNRSSTFFQRTFKLLRYHKSTVQTNWLSFSLSFMESTAVGWSPFCGAFLYGSGCGRKIVHGIHGGSGIEDLKMQVVGLLGLQ